MGMKVSELAALLCYFALVLAIGVYFFWKSRKSGGTEKEYFLGSRNMNGWVSAFSAGASAAFVSAETGVIAMGINMVSVNKNASNLRFIIFPPERASNSGLSSCLNYGVCVR